MPLQGLRQFTQQLLAVVDDRKIHEHLRDKHSRELVVGVVGPVRANIGPGDTPHAPYKASYIKQLKRKGQLAAKRMLVGGGHSPNDPKAMLFFGSQKKGGTYGNFGFVVEPDGSAALTWGGSSAEQDIYGAVHQGTPFGGKTHTKGHIPPRPWLHFQTSRAATAVMKAYEATFRELVAQFNAGRRI